MSNEPYRSAPRVFWILDNGTSHRGQRCVDRLRQRWPNVIVVHLPKHASWLNQIEIYFSVVQRKALTPADFASLDELKERIPSLSGATTRKSPDRSNGDSPVATWPSYSTS